MAVMHDSCKGRESARLVGKNAYLQPTKSAKPREARTFRDFIHAQVEYSDPKRINIDKHQSRAIAKACGIPTASLLAQWDRPAGFNPKDLPERFVLKPTNRCSRRGVHLLRRQSDDLFFEFLKGKSMSIPEIVFGMEAQGLTDIIAEELIPGPSDTRPIPLDYKLYTFSGKVHFIQQNDRNEGETRVCFLNAQFDELGPGFATSEWKRIKPGTPEIPANADKMIEAAHIVSAYLSRPFIRVDLYTTGDRLFLGEATPAPGEPYYGSIRFSSAFDAELGNLWRDGCRRLGWEIPVLKSEPPPL
jgi:hypothetical protein